MSIVISWHFVFPFFLSRSPASRRARAAAGEGTDRERLKSLQQFLFDEERFPFEYETRGTYGAQEAFRLRRGNCVSFTSLFIALGRSLGIPL